MQHAWLLGIYRFVKNRGLKNNSLLKQDLKTNLSSTWPVIDSYDIAIKITWRLSQIDYARFKMIVLDLENDVTLWLSLFSSEVIAPGAVQTILIENGNLMRIGAILIRVRPRCNYPYQLELWPCCIYGTELGWTISCELIWRNSRNDCLLKNGQTLGRHLIGCHNQQHFAQQIALVSIIWSKCSKKVEELSWLSCLKFELLGVKNGKD